MHVYLHALVSWYGRPTSSHSCSIRIPIFPPLILHTTILLKLKASHMFNKDIQQIAATLIMSRSTRKRKSSYLSLNLVQRIQC